MVAHCSVDGAELAVAPVQTGLQWADACRVVWGLSRPARGAGSWAVRRSPTALLTSTPLPHPLPSRMVVLPADTVCYWVGLGYVGCTGDFPCTTWVSDR